MTTNLQVYAITQDDGTRRVVASSAKLRAATLLGVSSYILATHGEVTNKADECKRALSDPGAVWARAAGAKTWVKTQDSAADKALPKRGGKRAGAGQPRIASGPAIQRGFRMDNENYARFMELGSVKFLRKVIAADLDLTDQEWAAFEEMGGAAWLREQIAAFSKAQD